MLEQRDYKSYKDIKSKNKIIKLLETKADNRVAQV